MMTNQQCSAKAVVSCCVGVGAVCIPPGTDSARSDHPFPGILPHAEAEIHRGKFRGEGPRAHRRQPHHCRCRTSPLKRSLVFQPSTNWKETNGIRNTSFPEPHRLQRRHPQSLVRQRRVVSLSAKPDCRSRVTSCCCRVEVPGSVRRVCADTHVCQSA